MARNVIRSRAGANENRIFRETRNRKPAPSRTSDAPIEGAGERIRRAARSAPGRQEEIAGSCRRFQDWRLHHDRSVAAAPEPDPFRSRALPAGTPEEQRAAAASHLAHDARNWLTVLQVYCDLLRSSGAVAGKGRTWIEELSNAVERGQGLVTSLLDSAQISARRSSPPP